VIVISSSGMLVMLGMGAGPSKLWLKLMFYDGFTAICGGVAAPPIIARPLQCLYIYKIIGLSKQNLFLRQKCFTDTGYACTSIVASKEPSSNNCQKPLSAITAYLFVMYTSAS
jgi:hypothetical protein